MEIGNASAATPGGGAKPLFDGETLSVGGYGELLRRAADAPLVFSFAWRGIGFKSTVESIDRGMRLSLETDLAPIPFSAEDAETRGGLFAIVDTWDGDSEGRLKIVQGRRIVLENDIRLPPPDGQTASTIVSQLTMLVLNAAPYLDLIAEYTPAHPSA